MAKNTTGVAARPKYATTEQFDFSDGSVIKVGDEFVAKLTGQSTRCVVRVMRLDVTADGALRDVTVALWSKTSGRAHPQRGLTRTITAEAAHEMVTR